MSTESVDTAEELRRRHSVRLVTPEEDGFSIHQLPNGVYGFTGSPAAAGAPLWSKRTFRSFEMHRAQDGVVYVVGYLTPEEFAASQSPEEPIPVHLYPEAYEAATQVAALEMLRIRHDNKPPLRDHGSFWKLQVLPRR